MENAVSAPRGGLFYFKRIIGALLLLALSATFFYSAYTKSGIEFHGFRLVANDNAFDSFQWTFLDLGFSSLLVAGIVARLFIGLELLLGLLLLCHVFLRQFTYKAVIAILTVFIIYLLIVIAKQGNTGNCGCFGDKLAMKPLTAIWKNLIMIGVTVILWFIYPVGPFRYQEYLFLLLALIGFSLPFVVNNVYTGTLPERYSKPVDIDLLYKYSPAPPVDLHKGKYILGYMSLTCPHCKKAAYLMHVIHQQHPDIPMFIVLDGPEPYKKVFFDETHASDIPNLYYRHTEEFIQMAGAGVPFIVWINNGVPEYRSVYAYYQLDPGFMEQWLHSGAVSAAK